MEIQSKIGTRIILSERERYIIQDTKELVDYIQTYTPEAYCPEEIKTVSSFLAKLIDGSDFCVFKTEREVFPF